MSEIWRAHTFREGNTITTITFISEFVKYRDLLLSKAYLVKYAVYMRKALVASVFEDEVLGKQIMSI
jgi:cell filamentation protein